MSEQQNHDEEMQEIMKKVFSDDTKFPTENPFIRFGFDALQTLTEALFIYQNHGHRMGFSFSQVHEIAQLPDREKDEALKFLVPSPDGPLLTEDDRALADMLDDLIMDAMAYSEAREIAKETIPDIEDFLKNQ